MSIIQAQAISKSFQGREILSGLSFAIDASDRIGLIGQNGTGKSTLLGLIAGHIPPDEGEIARAQSLVISMLGQRPLAYDHEGFAILENPSFLRMEYRMRDLESSMVNAKGDALDLLIADHSDIQARWEAEGAVDYGARLAKNLAGLGLTESQMRQPYDSLSGGEQMRVSIGRLLLEPSDLLLLDEPTNHLDHDGLEWLQSYLQSRRSALVVVSHDRWFLDQVCGQIYELENRRLFTYRGNFTESRAQKSERVEYLGSTIDRLSQRIRREEQVTQTMLSHRKMKSYHSREKVVRKLKNDLQTLQSEKNPKRRMTFTFLAPDGRKNRDRILLESSELGIAFDRLLFEDVSMTLCASEKIALVGPNGCGKTTLLRILLGQQEADEGKIRLYGDPVIAFMGQNVTFDNESLTVYEYLASAFPRQETEIRARLAQFGFRDEAMVKRLRSLSGGERHRLHLCALLELKPDILVLDEPTNHLDIETRRLLEETLVAYSGAVIAVSHDRYFIGAVSDYLLGFVGTQVLAFDDYQSWFESHKAAQEEQKATNTRPKSADEPVMTAADMRRVRAERRESLSRVAKIIEEREARRAAFEKADTLSHAPADYEAYAVLLNELDDLYQHYFTLEETIDAGLGD
ncbi:MAG TPA: ABC-F family ATP-binding cassette domain-containing protein [Clostridia bacterium]|nr:ABC-F family ATP-binding cassette domain-containing protein [Clostridia bacterium]